MFCLQAATDVIARFDIGPAAGRWVLWLALVMLAGAVITGAVLMRMGQLIYEDGTVNRDTGKPISPGPARRLGLMRFTRLGAEEFRRKIHVLSLRTHTLLLDWLRFDYRFMLFLYPALALLALWLAVFSGFQRWFRVEAWWGWVAVGIPALAWLADAIENRMALKAIGHTDEALKAEDEASRQEALEAGWRCNRAMKIAAAIKWWTAGMAVGLLITLVTLRLWKG